MARTVGEGKEVINLAKNLKKSLEEITRLDSEGNKILKTLQSTAKDNSYHTAENINQEIRLNLSAGMSDCRETILKLKAYGEFLVDMESK